jgi:diguanylate cyclase (GGDEF)-like protein
LHLRCLLFCLICFFSVGVSAAANLTEEERFWLSENSANLRVGLAEVKPYMVTVADDGQLEGLVIDYLDAIGQSLGVEWNYHLADSYGEMIRQAKNGDYGVVGFVTKTPARAEFLDFTEPFTFIENRIFVRQSSSADTGLQDLSGKKMALTAGSALDEHVSRYYSDIQLVGTKTSREAFGLLASGEVDAVGATVSSAYLNVFEAGLHNIRMAGHAGLDYAVAIGSSKEYPMLASIMSKGLASLSPEGREAINQRWVRPEQPDQISKATVTQLLWVGGILIFLVGLVAMTVWNRSLKREIAQRQEAEGRLTYLAYHDEISRVFNRQGFLRELDQAVVRQAEQHKHYAVIVFGLDHFRAKNDLLGQMVGNNILFRVAERIQSQLPDYAICARINGDEFAVLIQPAGLQELDHLIPRVLDNIAMPMLVTDGTVVLVSASAGFCLVTARNDRSEKALEQAEIAMKQAKRSCRGHYLRYSAGMSEQAAEEQEWKDQLKLAMHRNQQQLYLVYQPQIDLKSKSVVGFEALLRWQHPEKGMVSPALFVPMAERHGLIGELGLWVLNEACRQARAWLDEGISFDRIAVNVSVRQFMSAGFADEVVETLKLQSLPPDMLELEITESLFIAEFDKARATLEKLSRVGVRFSIDDFGTGFSSLMYLKQLPVEKLKLAQEFVLDLQQDVSSYQIVRAATQLGHSLGMTVIAEGVETAEIQQTLVELDCDQIQGYFYSRPLPPEEVCPQLMAQLGEQARQRDSVATDVAADVAE